MEIGQILRKADEALARQNFEYAVELLLSAVQMAPDAVPIRKKLRDAEIQKLRQTGREKSRPADALKALPSLLKGVIQLKILRNPEAALISFENFLRSAPTHRGAHMWAAQAADRSSLRATAIFFLESCNEMHEHDVRALRVLGELYDQVGKDEEAKKVYQEILEREKNDPHAGRRLREIEAKLEFSRRQGTTYKDLIKDKEKAERLELETHTLRTEEEIRRAISTLEEDHRQDPRQPKPLLSLTELHLRLGEFDQARSTLDKLEALIPGDFRLLRRRADVEIRVREVALRQARAAAKSAPENPELREAVKAAEQEYTRTAATQYRQLVEKHPTDLGLRFRLGQYLFQCAEYREAIQELQRAIGDPQRKQAILHLQGRCWLALGEAETAVKQFRQALGGTSGLDEESKNLTYDLARALKQLGQVGEAIGELQKIQEVDIAYRDVSDLIGRWRQEQPGPPAAP